MRNVLLQLIRDRSAATAVEYGLLVATIAAVMLGALGSLASESTATWTMIRERVVDAADGTIP